VSSTNEVRGIVAKDNSQRVSVERVQVPAPGPGEALISVKACALCRTDLLFCRGEVSDAFPFLLGHEASGIVEKVGDGVNHLEPGDLVVLNWRAICGRCRNCRRGRPWCLAPLNAKQKMTLSDGTQLTAVLGIGAFADKTLVAAGQCTKVNPNADPAAVCVLGCGVIAGIGAAVNTGNVARGDSVAVFGCGGVGNAAIAGARLAGAVTIVAVDVDDRKLALAKSFGATHGVNSSRIDPVEYIQSVTGGRGVDVAIDAVGLPAVYRQAFEARDLTSTLVLVGVPEKGRGVELPLRDMYARGGSLRVSWYGDCLPERDIPPLVDLHLQGRLNLDDFISETIPLELLPEAISDLERGDSLRSVVLFD
jgi:S-(hydroxymethyl)mycothiol dehydrogenase